MANSRMVVRDRGFNRLMRIVRAPLPEVTVGVHDSEGAATEEGGSITVAGVAETHEFGLGNVPERSWLRAYFDGNDARIKAMVRRAATAVLQGKVKPEQALNLIGLQIVGEIKSRIQSGIKPALSPRYLKRKGADKATPLIRFGQFIGSIKHKLVR